jgi:hypothetical protein
MAISNILTNLPKVHYEEYESGQDIKVLSLLFPTCLSHNYLPWVLADSIQLRDTQTTEDESRTGDKGLRSCCTPRGRTWELTRCDAFVEATFPGLPLSRCLELNFGILTARWKVTARIPIDSGLIFSFAGSVLVFVFGREQLLLWPELRVRRPEPRVNLPKQRLSMPKQSLSMAWAAWVRPKSACAPTWSPFWPPVCPGCSFLVELCPGIRFCSLLGFLSELILDLSCIIIYD